MNNKNQSPLHIAAILLSYTKDQSNHLKIYNILLENGAKDSIKDYEDKTAVDYFNEYKDQVFEYAQFYYNCTDYTDETNYDETAREINIRFTGWDLSSLPDDSYVFHLITCEYPDGADYPELKGTISEEQALNEGYVIYIPPEHSIYNNLKLFGEL